MSEPPRDLEPVAAKDLPPAIREDVVAVRFGLAGAPAGPDRAAARLALERLVRRFIRSEQTTQERPIP